MRKEVVALIAGVVVSGCAGSADDAVDAPLLCTAYVSFGIWVHVKDASTGAPLSGVTGRVQSGAFVDTLRDDGAGDGVYIGAPERRGTFSMHLEHPGYASLDISDIVVTGGPCHVEPTVLYDTLASMPQTRSRQSAGGSDAAPSR